MRPFFRLSKKSNFENESIETVGAIVNRPAVKCYGFAVTTGKYVGFSAGRLITAPTVFWVTFLFF